jgi:hypothetical protein
VQKLGTPELSAAIPGLRKPKTRSWDDNYRMFLDKMKAIAEGRETLAVPKGRGIE